MWKLILVCIFVATITNSSHAASSALKCKAKEKTLANLDIAKDAMSKIKLLLPSCANNCSTLTNSTACDAKVKSQAYLDIAINLLKVAIENYPNCNDCAVVDRNITEIIKNGNPVDCADVLENGQNVSGIYTIWPRLANTSLEVYCDMDTEGGGWTVLQRRGNFSTLEDFYRDWETYKNGFGNITEDFWIGNDNIYFLSNQKDYTLRFDLETVDKETRYAEYSYFRIEDENAAYKLHYENYTGNAGDGLELAKDRLFSTKDRHNDKPGAECAEAYKGGWWYWTSKNRNCYLCNPNGVYLRNGEKDYTSVIWQLWKERECLFATEMKLKPLYKKTCCLPC